MIIALHGKIGSGKDTTADILQRIRPNIQRRAIAHHVKCFVADITGTSPEFQYSTEGKQHKVLLDSTVFSNIPTAVNNLVYGRTPPLPDVPIDKETEILGRQILLAATQILTEMNQATSQPLDNVNVPKTTTCGILQQAIGTGLREKIHEDIWIEKLLQEWDDSLDWVITDVRFPNEKAYLEKKGAFLVRLQGDPTGTRAKSTRDINHVSETALDDCEEWFCTIDNSINDLSMLEGNVMCLLLVARIPDSEWIQEKPDPFWRD